MNILLIDDDKYILEGLSHGIEWDKLPFTSRYQARNARQAKAVIEKVDIQIILCDIEMPGESGLDLLQWIRENNYPIEVIFLTSHPDFAYAQRAISLGSFEYILKPFEYQELTDVLLRAAQKAEENMMRTQYFSLRSTDEMIMRERKMDFFRKLVAGYNTDDETLIRDIEEGRLGYTLDDEFVLYVINVRNVEELSWRDDGQVYYVLQSVISEKLKYYSHHPEDIQLETIWKENLNLWAVAMKVSRMTDDIWYILGKTLTDTRKGFKWRNEFSAYISEVVPMNHVHWQWVTIRKMIFDNIAVKNGVFFVNNFDSVQESEEVPFDREAVERAFDEGDEQAMSRLVDEFILELGSRRDVDSRAFQKSVMDWQQAVFRHLEKNQIVAETMYANDEYIALYQKIGDSLEDYRVFLHYITEEAFLNTRRLKEADGSISILKRYIDDHLSGDLSRSVLANVVFLNGDYMASLFKKKTGLSIKRYVFERRMNRARELLQTTNEPIYSIALKVGYPSASYFTKQFKQYYDKEPNEFRRRAQ